MMVVSRRTPTAPHCFSVILPPTNHTLDPNCLHLPSYHRHGRMSRRLRTPRRHLKESGLRQKLLSSYLPRCALGCLTHLGTSRYPVIARQFFDRVSESAVETKLGPDHIQSYRPSDSSATSFTRRPGNKTEMRSATRSPTRAIRKRRSDQPQSSYPHSELVRWRNQFMWTFWSLRFDILRRA